VWQQWTNVKSNGDAIIDFFAAMYALAMYSAFEWAGQRTKTVSSREDLAPV